MKKLLKIQITITSSLIIVILHVDNIFTKEKLYNLFNIIKNDLNEYKLFNDLGSLKL